MSDYACHIQQDNEHPATSSEMRLFRPYVKCHGITANAEVRMLLPVDYQVIDEHDNAPEVGNECSVSLEYDYTIVVGLVPESAQNPHVVTCGTPYMEAGPGEIGQLLNVYVVEDHPDPAQRAKRGHSKSAVPTRSIGIVPKL